MKRLPIYLLIGIPLASVVMGIITLIVAFSGPDQELPDAQAPLRKTSWRLEAPAEDGESQRVD
jgi:hypothetical protein